MNNSLLPSSNFGSPTNDADLNSKSVAHFASEQLLRKVARKGDVILLGLIIGLTMVSFCSRK